MKRHYLKPLAPPYADYDRPGRLLASADAGSGTVIVLDDHRVRSYYGPVVEELIDAAHAAEHWLAEDLASKDGVGHVEPREILKRLDEAHATFASCHYAAHELNTVVRRLLKAINETRAHLWAIGSIVTPSPAMLAATAALKPAGDPRQNVRDAMERVRARLVVALAPFGEVTR